MHLRAYYEYVIYQLLILYIIENKYVIYSKYSFKSISDKCCIKRKSTGGDAIDGKVDDTTTPEKKAKLDEEAPAEAETAA